MLKKIAPVVLMAVLVNSTALMNRTVRAQENAVAQADNALAQIREEGLERSQVMNTVHFLTDRFGPRLTGSPSLVRAGEWALGHLEEIGLQNAHKEAWDWGHEGWENERLSAHIVSPLRQPLIGEVLAWTPSTNGPVSAAVFNLVPPETPTEEELNAYYDSIRDDIAGKIVFDGKAAIASSSMDFPERREDVEIKAQYHPYATGGGRRYGRGPKRPEGTLSSREVSSRTGEFLVNEGALVRVTPANMVDGLIRAFGNRSYDSSTAIPTVILRNEDYSRIARLYADDLPIELEFNIENKIYPDGATAYNFIAEIPGTEFPDQVVMLGAHLDSWHAGTGATDNAAGSAIMMEAVRIIRALDLQPRRTIRIALWSGEEQGLLGSQAYVEKHFGSYEKPTAEYANFDGYINVDSGTGKLRGASVFGPPAAAVILHKMMTPLNDLGMFGARSTASRGIGGSDHTSFNHAGLPGISMGQDLIRYFTHTWHTNLDVYDQLLADDLKQAAVVVASTIYQLAMRDELLPRFSDTEMPRLNGAAH